MIYYEASALINVITSLLLGIFVYYKSTEKFKKYFILFCVAFWFWSLCYFIWQISQTELQAFFWAKGLMMGAIFCSITYFHFAIYFLKIQDKQKWMLRGGYFIFIIFAILNFTDLFVAKVEPALNFQFWPMPGIAFHPFLAIWFFYIMYTCYLLFKKYYSSHGIKRFQIKIILAGFLIAFAGGSTNYFLWYDIPIPPFGNIIASVFVVFTAYAITRYRFMDIQVVIKRNFIYFLLLIVAFSVSLALIISIYFVLTTYANAEPQIASLISMALLIIILPTLQKHLRNVLKKYIRDDAVDLSAKIEEFASSIESANQLNQLLSKTADFVKTKVQTEDVKFLTRDFRVPDLQYVCQYPKDCTLSNISELRETKNYFSENNIIVKDELPYLQVDDKALVRKLRKFLDKTNSQIIISFVKEDVINGYMFLGNKSDNTIYTKEDIDFLISLANEFNSAFNKVLFYEETVERVRREFGNNKTQI